MRHALALILLAIAGAARGQSFVATVEVLNYECQPSSARVTVSGTPQQTVQTSWSNGQSNVSVAEDLPPGSHSVHVFVSQQKDSLLLQRDTLVTFEVPEMVCAVSIPLYFSPNGDGYKDVLSITHVDRYPDFEFSVFNKWGQRVHHQSKHYDPWDGTWNGIALPDATYYYVFVYSSSNKKKLLKGDVTILR